jgi:hypothetical protein
MLSFSKGGGGKPLQGVINSSSAESRLARFQFQVFSVWSSRSGIPPSLDDGKSGARARLSFRISTEAFFDPLRLPCRKWRSSHALRATTRQPPDQRRDFVPGFANYD